MVATRSSGGGSRADTPKKQVTVSARIEKPKKAAKAKNRPSRPSAPPMKIEDLEFESKLMKEVLLGETLFSDRLYPAWPQYAGACLMGLPGDVLDKIINFILPINEPRQQQSSAARPSDGQENFQRPFFHCTYIHPILQTCRELRYEYGQRFLANNNFWWVVPRDWDSAQITLFTQHAASVGAPGFRLLMDMSNRVDGPGYNCYPREPLREGCRANLDRWMKTVYYGVETRVLVNDWPLRRDDGLIAHFLHQAQQYRQQGKSWEQLLESLEEAWEAFLERRELAAVNLGKDVATMTALYKASNARLEMARASGLGMGGSS